MRALDLAHTLTGSRRAARITRASEAVVGLCSRGCACVKLALPFEPTTESTMLHHVSVGVRDVERAARFYDTVLDTLGCKRVMEFLPYAVAYGTTAPELWIQLPADRNPASVGNGVHIAAACLGSPAGTCGCQRRLEALSVRLKLACQKLFQNLLKVPILLGLLDLRGVLRPQGNPLRPCAPRRTLLFDPPALDHTALRHDPPHVPLGSDRTHASLRSKASHHGK